MVPEIKPRTSGFSCQYSSSNQFRHGVYKGWGAAGHRSSVARALVAKARCPEFNSQWCHFLSSPMLFQRSTDSSDVHCVLFRPVALRSSDVAPSIGPGRNYAQNSFLLDVLHAYMCSLCTCRESHRLPLNRYLAGDLVSWTMVALGSVICYELNREFLSVGYLAINQTECFSFESCYSCLTKRVLMKAFWPIHPELFATPYTQKSPLCNDYLFTEQWTSTYNIVNCFRWL